MISGKQFSDAVSRAGGVGKAAALIDVHPGTVNRWRHEGVPGHRTAAVDHAFRAYLHDGEHTVRDRSDMDLLAELNSLIGELAGRLAEARTASHQTDIADSGQNDNGSASTPTGSGDGSDTLPGTRGNRAVGRRRTRVNTKGTSSDSGEQTDS